MTDANASISFKIRATFSKGKQKMEQKTKEKGNKQIRKNKGEDVGIYVYTMKAQNGIVMEYVNESSSFKLMESISFDMKNCSLEGYRGDELKITLTPGETESYRIIPDGSGRDWDARTKSCKYAVVEANSSFAFT